MGRGCALSKRFTFTLILIFVCSCATKPRKVTIGECQLNSEQSKTYAEIKKLGEEISKKTKRFDQELSKGPVDLFENKNYQELLALKSERDQSINYLASSLKGNSLCLKKLFKKDLNFPELIDEK